MKPDIEKLKKVLDSYDNERYKLSHLIRMLEEVPKLKALVGKYFKHRSYYSNQKSWWLFYCIKDYKKGSLIVCMFEEDSNGRVQFIIERREYSVEFYNPSYIEITKKEYENAAKKILKKLSKNFQNK